jgi:hypothetical protein
MSEQIVNSDAEVAAAVRGMPAASLDEWRRYAAGEGKKLSAAELSKVFHPRYMRDDPKFVCYSCGQRAVAHTPEQTGRCIARWMSHVMQHSPSGAPMPEPRAAHLGVSTTAKAAASEIPWKDRWALAKMRAAREAAASRETKPPRRDRINPYVVRGVPDKITPLGPPYQVTLPKEGE